jgi:hypothetical protein
MELPRTLWAYFGPETTLPLASVLGAVIGVLLMGWYFFIGIIKKLVRICFWTGSDVSPTTAPHGHAVHADMVAPDDTQAGCAKDLNGTDKSTI